jgi:hypothetical protein
MIRMTISRTAHATGCGGEGFIEYLECPEVWGEDCPSEVNHLVTCPDCAGTGRI